LKIETISQQAQEQSINLNAGPKWLTQVLCMINFLNLVRLDVLLNNVKALGLFTVVLLNKTNVILTQYNGEISIEYYNNEVILVP
jgi:hypothetical protein